MEQCGTQDDALSDAQLLQVQKQVQQQVQEQVQVHVQERMQG